MKIILSGIILGMLLVLSNTHVSDSYLYWNLLVTVKPEKTPIKENEYPVITGTVTDEASKPIENALVKITFAKEIVTTTTDASGSFRYQSALLTLPGYYMINIVATKDGYGTGLASSNIMVNQLVTETSFVRGFSGEPIVTGNFTVYLGKVTEWNLETTCFVKFGNEYKRFLKTCDLYNFAPSDFQTDTPVVHTVTVIQYNNDSRLFPAKDYFSASVLANNTQTQFIENTWANYTISN